MTNTVHLEVESTFEVDQDVSLPDFTGLPDLVADSLSVHSLSAVYYDTEDLTLFRHRITLRRRTGGDDAGWHLKRPSPDRSGRQELRAPLGEPDIVPTSLTEAVLGLLRRRPLVPVARVDNNRHVIVLRDSAGAARVEFCDDHVSTARLIDAPGDPGGNWREWEVELVDPRSARADDDAAALAQACTDAGARPSGYPSKLGRALGPRPFLVAGTSSPLHHALRTDVDQLLDHDPGARLGEVEGIHQARVAVRGLRSTIATYAPDLDTATTAVDLDLAALADELKLFATILGKVRDIQVVRQRLSRLCGEYPEDLVGPAIRDRINAELDSEEARTQSRVTSAMRSERYIALIDALEQLSDLTSGGSVHSDSRSTKTGHGAEMALHGVDRQYKRFAKVRTRTERDLDSLELTLAQREELAHVVRKRAKALRRGVSALAGPGYDDAGYQVAPLRTACQRLHSVLGEVQDSVTTRAWIRRIAVRAEDASEATFGLGVLYEHERRVSEQTLAGFEADAATVTAAYNELAESRRAARNRRRPGKKKR